MEKDSSSAIYGVAQSVRKSWLSSLRYTEEDRMRALERIAHDLIEAQEQLLEINHGEREKHKKNQLPAALLERMTFTAESVRAMAEGVREVADAPAVIGERFEVRERPNGLRVYKEAIPLGVIGMVFESRPNVVVDGAALAIKSGNALILKGGKEAKETNLFLGRVIRQAIGQFLPQDLVCVIDQFGRSGVRELIGSQGQIDLIIPRGGRELIDFVRKHATVPVLAHDKGLCHIYLHHDADPELALDICYDSKVPRPGVCNAVETLILHSSLVENFLPRLLEKFHRAGVRVHCEESIHQKFPKETVLIAPDGYSVEYLDKQVSLKVVDDLPQALAHINRYGSRHTECIVTKNQKTWVIFKNSLDASCVLHNASTCFNDGQQLGLGAELGISTSKVGAYGPMGAREMMVHRYVVEGSGQVRYGSKG